MRPSTSPSYPRAPIRMSAIVLLFTAVLTLLLFSENCAADVGKIRDDEDTSIRALAIGDFAELNELIKPAVLRLSDTSVSRDMVSFDIWNLRCTSFQLGDMTISSRKDTARRVTVPLNIIDLDMVCSFDYSFWAALIFSGRGSATVTSSGSDIFSSMAVLSTNPSGTLATKPPDLVVFEKCETNILVDRINFQGGVMGWIANAIENSLRGKLADIAGRKLCEALDEWSKTTLDEQLGKIEREVAKFPAGYDIDPLLLERSLRIPEFVTLLNLRNEGGDDESLSDYVHMALDESIDYLREVTYDLENAIPGPGPTDMNVNIFLRNHFLDSNRALKVEASEISLLEAGGLLWEGTDRLTKTSIFIDEIRIKGLDTLNRFDPIETIGDYTIQSRLSWDFIRFECDATLIIQASDRPDSVLTNPGREKIVDQATLSFQINDASAVLSLLLAIDQGLLEAIEIGSLLRTDKIAPCLLSTIFDVAISSLDLNMKGIDPPTLVGFVSPGIDRIFSRAVAAIDRVFRDLMMARLPTFFHLSVRNIFNEHIGKYWEHAENNACSWTASTESPSSEDAVIDLRDLLLLPDDALSAGASGLEPYGDLFSSVIVPKLDSKLVPSDDADGLPLLNDDIVRPLTKMQSGIEGTLSYNSELFAVESVPSVSSSGTRMLLKASNMTVKNLDIVHAPVSILKPTSSQTLNNQVSLGPIDRKPLLLSSTVTMSASGGASALQMYNEFELQVSMPSSELLFDVFAAVREARLLSLPLQYIDNIFCWLDTLQPQSQLSNELSDSVAKSPLDLSRLFVSLSEIRLSARCTECSSSGLLDLNDILFHIEDAGFSILLKDRLERLSEELIWQYYLQLNMPETVAEASRRCPYSLYYDPNTAPSETKSDSSETPALSLDALETLLGISAMAAETAIIVAAKSHVGGTLTDPFYRQLDLQNETKYLSLQNPGSKFGNRVASAMSHARQYLIENKIDETNGESDLGINILMRSHILDQGGTFTLPLNQSMATGGTELTVSAVRIDGLDAVTDIHSLMEITGSQTFENSLTFETLKVYLDIIVVTDQMKTEESIGPEKLTLTLSLDEVRVDFSLFLAAEEAKLNLLELGSLMFFDKAPRCLLSHIEILELTQLVVQPNNIRSFEVEEGFFSERYRYDLNSILRSTSEAFYGDLIEGLPFMFDDSVRKLLNDVLANIRRDERSNYCDWSNDLIDTGFVDFRDLFLSETVSREQGGGGDSPYGDLLRILYSSFEGLLLNADSINSYLQTWTLSESGVEGSVWYEGEVYNSSSAVNIAGFGGKATVKIADPALENVDSFIEPLAFLEPVSAGPNELHTAASFGDGNRRFHVGGRATLGLSDNEGGMNLLNEVDFSLSLTSLSYLLQFYLNMPQDRLYDFPVKDLLNVNCWLVAILSPIEDSPHIQSVGLVEQDLDAKGFQIDVKCVSCSSPRFDDLISHLYATNEGKSDGLYGNEVLNSAISSVVGGGFLRDRLLLEASRHCPATEDFDPNATWGEILLKPSATTDAEKNEKASRDSKAMWFNAAMAIITGVVLGLVILMKLIDRHRHKKWVSSLDDEAYSIFQQQLSKEDEIEQSLSKELPSMLFSTIIPRHIRFGVLFAIIADIGLFAAGHFAVISSVDLTGHVAGEVYFIKDFLSFSFVSSLVRTYQNGGNEMAVLMLIFSGLYPYLKLLVLAVMWMVPPRYLGGTKRRGSFLLWMDVLAKLSVIDIITMLLLAAVVLVFVGGPAKVIASQTADDTSSLYSVEAIVTPAAGFYCFVMAQRLSRISSKYLLEKHHLIVAQATKEYEVRVALPTADRTVSTFLSDDSFPVDHSSNSSNRGHHDEEKEEMKEPCNSSTAPAKSTNLEAWLRSSAAAQAKTKTTKYEPYLEGQYPASLTRSSSSATGEDLTVSSMSHKHRGCVRTLARLGGTAGSVFSAITVISVFIIGIVIAPSIRLDTRTLWSLAIESGKTFKEAIQTSFFRTISFLLLQARFMMRSRGDYIGLLILFCLVGISSVLYPLLRLIIRLGRWQHQRRKRKRRGLPKKAKKSKKMPTYIKRLYLWRGMDVYIISFVVAVWQLGAVSAYVIHLYCSLLDSLFTSLSYFGLAERSEAQCFRIQASLPMTVFIICASFVFLLIAFLLQASGHYKSNQRRVEKMIETEMTLRRSCQFLTRSARSSSFWNLGRTQLIDIDESEEDDIPDISTIVNSGITSYVSSSWDEETDVGSREVETKVEIEKKPVGSDVDSNQSPV